MCAPCKKVGGHTRRKTGSGQTKLVTHQIVMFLFWNPRHHHVIFWQYWPLWSNLLLCIIVERWVWYIYQSILYVDIDYSSEIACCLPLFVELEHVECRRQQPDRGQQECHALCVSRATKNIYKLIASILTIVSAKVFFVRDAYTAVCTLRNEWSPWLIALI